MTLRDFNYKMDLSPDSQAPLAAMGTFLQSRLLSPRTEARRCPKGAHQWSASQRMPSALMAIMISISTNTNIHTLLLPVILAFFQQAYMPRICQTLSRLDLPEKTV